MSDIVLLTINARFQHAAFGLRYLYANLGDLKERTILKELSLGVRERDVVEQILVHDPKIVALSIYIWNVQLLTAVAVLLKRIRPDVTLLIGGPEVSHEWEEMIVFQQADFLVRGEGDLVFAELCREILSDQEPGEKVRAGGLPLLNELASPYSEYTDFDLEHGRIIYVEASRGCPFQCHFCLSSLDKSVRAFELDDFLAEMDKLFRRGVRQFKFVDRTFNLRADTSTRILQFFLDRYEEGMFLHFEMIPDRLPESLRPIIKAFPPGVLQFEVGIQSFNQEVCARIGRRQKFKLIDENLGFLSRETGVHVHADLIAGLPGEDMKSFGEGFDKLVSLGPEEIQVGILKRLRGTPMTLADPEWEMLYSPEAPYEVLKTSHLSFLELQRLSRFSRYWDLVANSGRFPDLVGELLSGDSAFWEFMAFSEWLYERVGATHGIAAKRLENLLRSYLSDSDLGRNGRGPGETSPRLPKRQRRRLTVT